MHNMNLGETQKEIKNNLKSQDKSMINLKKEKSQISAEIVQGLLDLKKPVRIYLTKIWKILNNFM